MATDLAWSEVAIRLALTVLAGAVVGVNRGEHGRPAGLRTTILVCLAASVSMIQANLLLGSEGRTPASFAVMDLMRLPLGILSGMGFIGAGAILRRGDRVLGVTTAATLWFVTVMGLCFGGGQIGLGLTLLAIAIGVLWGLKVVEQRLPQDKRGLLSLTIAHEGPQQDELFLELAAAGFRVVSCSMKIDAPKQRRKMRCEVQWRGRLTDATPPAALSDLAQRPGILALEWQR